MQIYLTIEFIYYTFVQDSNKAINKIQPNETHTQRNKGTNTSLRIILY